MFNVERQGREEKEEARKIASCDQAKKGKVAGEKGRAVVEDERWRLIRRHRRLRVAGCGLRVGHCHYLYLSSGYWSLILFVSPSLLCAVEHYYRKTHALSSGGKV